MKKTLKVCKLPVGEALEEFLRVLADEADDADDDDDDEDEDEDDGTESAVDVEVYGTDGQPLAHVRRVREIRAGGKVWRGSKLDDFKSVPLQDGASYGFVGEDSATVLRGERIGALKLAARKG